MQLGLHEQAQVVNTMPVECSAVFLESAGCWDPCFVRGGWDEMLLWFSELTS